MAGDADNFITNIHIGRSFNTDGAVPRLGADVPRWYGETIGFWDGDALITWTSNIQGWKVHGNPEFSSKLQTIEIYTPNRDAAGNVIGLNHEGIFYDPEALVEPIRMIRNLERISGFDDGDPVHLHRVRADDLSRRRPRRRRSSPGDRDPIQGARHVRPALGARSGRSTTRRHAAARRRGHLQLRLAHRPKPRPRLATVRRGFGGGSPEAKR